VVTARFRASGNVRWDRAQQGYLDLSRKLAELIQIQMAQRFRGSPEIPTAAAVRQLRTIAAPAVAIEVSSVSLPDRAPLDKMAPVLADGVARAVAAFRLVYEAGAKIASCREGSHHDCNTLCWRSDDYCRSFARHPTISGNPAPKTVPREVMSPSRHDAISLLLRRPANAATARATPFGQHPAPFVERGAVGQAHAGYFDRTAGAAIVRNCRTAWLPLGISGEPAKRCAI